MELVPDSCEECGAGPWTTLFLGKRLCPGCLAYSSARRRRIQERIRRTYAIPKADPAADDPPGPQAGTSCG